MGMGEEEDDSYNECPFVEEEEEEDATQTMTTAVAAVTITMESLWVIQVLLVQRQEGGMDGSMLSSFGHYYGRLLLFCGCW
jgi:hypothetical protein